MTRDATSWSASTAGPRAFAARPAAAPRLPATAGPTPRGLVRAAAAARAPPAPGRAASVARHGRGDTRRHRQRCRGGACNARFDDLTGTVLAGHHRPLRVWVLCLHLMGLNLSNRQIAQELDLSQPDVQLMTEQLRIGLVAKTPPVK